MNWPAHVTVAAIVERGDHFLMVQENIHGVSVLNQPAGHLEQNESLCQAVVRETLEETGWHFEPRALVGIYRWVHPRGDTFLRFCFTGEASYQETNPVLDQGIEQVLWLSHDELQRQTERLRSPLVLACIGDYLGGQRVDLSLLQDIQ